MLTQTNYGLTVYEMNMALAVAMIKEVNLETLNDVRTNFRENYYANDNHVEHPNALFEYQKTIQEAGHFEAYNYWLLSQGAADEFGVWKEANEDAWTAFIDWFGPNPIELDDSNKFVQP